VQFAILRFEKSVGLLVSFFRVFQSLFNLILNLIFSMDYLLDFVHSGFVVIALIDSIQLLLCVEFCVSCCLGN
jgi:hypothetical protein